MNGITARRDRQPSARARPAAGARARERRRTGGSRRSGPRARTRRAAGRTIRHVPRRARRRERFDRGRRSRSRCGWVRSRSRRTTRPSADRSGLDVSAAASTQLRGSPWPRIVTTGPSAASTRSRMCGPTSSTAPCSRRQPPANAPPRNAPEMKHARPPCASNVVGIGEKLAHDVGESVGEQHRPNRRRWPATASAMRRRPATSSASGFSSSTALPAFAGTDREFGLCTGATASATASHRVEELVEGREAWLTPWRRPTRPHASGVRDHTPASSVSGPAAMSGACTMRAHGPAPASPTRTGPVIDAGRSPRHAHGAGTAVETTGSARTDPTYAVMTTAASRSARSETVTPTVRRSSTRCDRAARPSVSTSTTEWSRRNQQARPCRSPARCRRRRSAARPEPDLATGRGARRRLRGPTVSRPPSATAWRTRSRRPRNRARADRPGVSPHVDGPTGAHAPTVIEDDDRIRKRERLVEVVGDEQRGVPLARMIACSSSASSSRRSRSTDASGSSSIKQPRRGRQGAGQRDPLLLAAREFVDPRSLGPREADEREHLGDPARASVPRRAPHAEPEGDVADTSRWSNKRVVLEHQPEIAAMRRNGGEVGAVPAQPSRRSWARGRRSRAGALVLPLPLGPETATISPSATVRSTSSTATGRRTAPRVPRTVEHQHCRPTRRDPVLARERDAAGDHHQDRCEGHRLVEVGGAGPAEEPEDRDGRRSWFRVGR